MKRSTMRITTSNPTKKVDTVLNGYALLSMYNQYIVDMTMMRIITPPQQVAMRAGKN
jgi:hypothetical protein